ncbi:MAG: methyltransferase, partial [Bryobacteraceae bacterium]
MTTDPTVVLDLIEAFRHSKTMFTAVSMGVFDALAEAPATAATLAARLGMDLSALERLLDGCVGLGLLLKADGLYRNTGPADAYLCRNSPQTMAGYILYSDRVLYPIWGNLESAMREGTNRWGQTFGLDGPLFSAFFRTDEALREFILGMHGFGLLTSPAVVNGFDLSRFRRFVDLGGATGHLAMAAKQRYPEMSAAVFDLPRVIGFAQEFVDGVDLVAGDFFADPLPDADLYGVGRILHDWSEEKIERLLDKVYAALPDGGGLLIAEKLLDEDKSGPVPTLMQSLNMLVVTEGRERTLSEYDTLLRRAGFLSVDGRKTGTPLDVVLAL